jgi:hypothetical protein
MTDERQRKLEREIGELENKVATLRDDIREKKALTGQHFLLSLVLGILQKKKSELAKLNEAK